MIRTLYASPSRPLQFDVPLDDIPSLLKDPDGLLWVSLERTTVTEIEQVLANLFHFHPLTVEDCLSTGYQVPKVDDFGEYIFLIVHALIPNQLMDDFKTEELNCYLGKNYLVTSFIDPVMSSVETTWGRVTRDERLTQNGPDMLLHAILDALVDEYIPLLDTIDEEIDELEDQVLANPRPPLLARILALKHALLVLRRMMSPQREVMNRLSRDDFHQIDRQARIYFRDVYDHVVRFQDLTETLRDVISSTLDTYLSASSNRMNEVMKALTVVSTIFLPLSFVAGVYGMNFEFMPELHWRYGYLFVWGIFIAIAALMLYIFRRRGWF